MGRRRGTGDLDAALGRRGRRRRSRPGLASSTWRAMRGHAVLPAAAAKARHLLGVGEVGRRRGVAADLRRQCPIRRASSTSRLVPEEGRLRFGITESGSGGGRTLEAPGPRPGRLDPHRRDDRRHRRRPLREREACRRESGPDPAPWRLVAAERLARPERLRGRSSLPGKARLGAVLRPRPGCRRGAPPWASPPDDLDLLARYPLDETGGLFALDASPSGNDAEIRGDPLRDGAAYGLDGAADHLRTPISNGSARTLSAWIRPLSSDNVPYIESVFDTNVPGQHGSGWGLDAGRIKVVLDDRFWEPACG